MRLTVAAPTAAAYLLTIVAANWAIHRFGVVPVGFGYVAPAGVYFVALALVLRDLLQWSLGRRAGQAPEPWQTGVMLAVILAGAGLSFLVADPRVAAASALAFGFSELVDFGLFTWVAPRWALAVLVAGLAAAIVDSVIFLDVAFGSLEFLPGQILGKGYGVVAAALLIALRRRVVPA
jgi:uncharacterized PurR-regulated membrane protein YhhQ (DUF165 family)